MSGRVWPKNKKISYFESDVERNIRKDDLRNQGEIEGGGGFGGEMKVKG